MNYLGLINNVLTRLREDTIAESQFDSTPFYKLIGACVNDAKDAVENAWQWGCLRGTDSATTTIGNSNVLLPNSIDNHYLLKNVLLNSQGTYLTCVTPERMQENYANRFIQTPPQGAPMEYCICSDFYNDSNPQDPLNGSQQITLWPTPDQAYGLSVYRVKHQDPLSGALDVLRVPSLPVYTLATALASRERGEVGGTPSSELFAIAAVHLSDAIALDTTRFPEELIWWVDGNSSKTNIGGAY